MDEFKLVKDGLRSESEKAEVDRAYANQYQIEYEAKGVNFTETDYDPVR